VAARQGHDKVMRMMLTKFKPDLEKEGTVKFDGYVIEGASALWCAACAGTPTDRLPKPRKPIQNNFNFASHNLKIHDTLISSLQKKLKRRSFFDSKTFCNFA
jgi:hypothetical protein